jgi:hypothetical protein
VSALSLRDQLQHVNHNWWNDAGCLNSEADGLRGDAPCRQGSCRELQSYCYSGKSSASGSIEINTVQILATGIEQAAFGWKMKAQYVTGTGCSRLLHAMPPTSSRATGAVSPCTPPRALHLASLLVLTATCVTGVYHEQVVIAMLKPKLALVNDAPSSSNRSNAGQVLLWCGVVWHHLLSAVYLAGTHHI